MGRKQVDVGMMEEVIADRDVESLQRRKLTPRIAPLPVTPRPTLSSYLATAQRSFGKRAMGAASVAVCVAIAIGILSIPPATIDSIIQASSEAWSTHPSTGASIGNSTEVKPYSGPGSSSLSVQAAELPHAGSGQPSPSSGDTGIDTIIVQPGETLRQIILRTMGDYNSDAIEQIRLLNPEIADFDHLESGQTIRFLKVTVPVDSAPVSAGTRTAGKN
jgi:hypothetical protein